MFAGLPSGLPLGMVGFIVPTSRWDLLLYTPPPQGDFLSLLPRASALLGAHSASTASSVFVTSTNSLVVCDPQSLCQLHFMHTPAA